jgi:Sec-independent protein secretion pathway component TatC
MTHAEERMTLVEHLAELHKRLFISAAAIAVCMLVAAILQKYVFKLLVHPLLPWSPAGPA